MTTPIDDLEARLDATASEAPAAWIGPELARRLRGRRWRRRAAVAAMVVPPVGALAVVLALLGASPEAPGPSVRSPAAARTLASLSTENADAPVDEIRLPVPVPSDRWIARFGDRSLPPG
ncbi:MAG: hypothetical protein R3B49_00995 [Phycisphaerales bacterium]